MILNNKTKNTNKPNSFTYRLYLEFYCFNRIFYPYFMPYLLSMPFHSLVQRRFFSGQDKDPKFKERLRGDSFLEDLTLNIEQYEKNHKTKFFHLMLILCFFITASCLFTTILLLTLHSQESSAEVMAFKKRNATMEIDVKRTVIELDKLRVELATLKKQNQALMEIQAQNQNKVVVSPGYLVGVAMVGAVIGGVFAAVIVVMKS